MADDTIVVFTSDHGDLLGAHGGLQQKWCNAFDEAIRVPFLVSGPGIAATAEGVSVPTSHVDLIPTLLGLGGIDVDRAIAGVAEHHTEVHPLVGRDLSAVPTGAGGADELWKLNHYYDRLDDWNAEHGVPIDPFAAPAAEPVLEVHNLTVEPEERDNLAGRASEQIAQLLELLAEQRDAKRLLPRLRNA